MKNINVSIYEAEDGTKFDNEAECLAYELISKTYCINPIIQKSIFGFNKEVIVPSDRLMKHEFKWDSEQLTADQSGIRYRRCIHCDRVSGIKNEMFGG